MANRPLLAIGLGQRKQAPTGWPVEVHRGAIEGAGSRLSGHHGAGAGRGGEVEDGEVETWK